MTEQNTTMTMYHTGLRNQHAVETQAIGTIRNELPRMTEYPELSAKMKEDKARSTEHALRLNALFSRHGTRASLAKETVTGKVATVAGFIHALPPTRRSRLFSSMSATRPTRSPSTSPDHAC